MKTLPAMPRRCLAISWVNLRLLLLTLATIFASAGAAFPQPSTLSQIKSLYVEPFDGGSQAPALRDSFIHRLRKSGKYKIGRAHV